MKFIKLPAVKEKTGLGKSSIYEMMADNRFPKNIRLGKRAVAWEEASVEKWMEERLKNA